MSDEHRPTVSRISVSVLKLRRRVRNYVSLISYNSAAANGFRFMHAVVAKDSRDGREEAAGPSEVHFGQSGRREGGAEEDENWRSNTFGGFVPRAHLFQATDEQNEVAPSSAS